MGLGGWASVWRIQQSRVSWSEPAVIYNDMSRLEARYPADNVRHTTPRHAKPPSV